MVGTQETFVKRKTDQQRKRKRERKSQKEKRRESERQKLVGRKGKIRVGIKLLQL